MSEIVIISPSLLEGDTVRGGAIEKIDFNVAKELSQIFTVGIVSPYHKEYMPSSLVKENLTMYYVPFPAVNKYPIKSSVGKALYFLLKLFYCFFLVPKLIMIYRKNVRVVIVHTGIIGLTALLTSKLYNIRVLYSEGNLDPWVELHSGYEGNLTYKILRMFRLLNGLLIAKHSHAIRVQSKSIMRGMVNRNIEKERIWIIPGGVDTKIYFPSKEVVINNKIGFIGRLEKEKGVDLLYEIIRTAQKRSLPFEFYIFGDGKYRYMFEDFGNIKHLGFCNTYKLIEKLADINVVISFNKELGLAELEVLSMGKVLIINRTPETTEVIKDRGNGILVNATTSEYIDALLETLYDKELIINISRKARSYALQHFSWTAIGRQWKKLCQLIMEGSKI